LDKALKKLPANEDGDAFYRGIMPNGKRGEALYNFLLNAKPGTKLKDPGFGSYSSDKVTAEGFSGTDTAVKSIMFISRSKALRPLNVFSDIPEEYEALMPRNTTSVIRKVTREGNRLIVETD
jgi:hypothetical protein